MKECTMSKSKVVSTKVMTPVRGGKGHMFGKQTVGQQKAGVTGKAITGGGGKTTLKGGSGKMFGKQTAKPAKPGVSR